jgi:uncharacterized membrane protein
MASCEQSEIAVEQRAHGALSEPDRAPLDRHLAGCQACREYAAAVQATEAELVSCARAAIADLDWGRVERGIRAGPTASLRMLAGALLAGSWVAAVTWLSALTGSAPDRMLRSLPAMAIVVVMVALVAGYSGRRLVAQVGRGEVLATSFQMVAEHLQWANRMRWAIAGLLAFFLYRALTGRSATYDPPVYFGGLAVPLAGVWAYLRHVKIPRAEREVLDLNPGEGAVG